MSFFIVDVESDGPAPGLYSMISFGAIKVDSELKTGFKRYMKPISEQFVPSALAVSAISREEQLRYPDPKLAMIDFVAWVKANSKGRPIFVSDNVAYDWQFINYYCHLFAGENPFGHTGRRIGDFYSGLERDLYASSKWKKYRNTTHDHDPLNDAIGNAEAFLKICNDYKIKVPE
jgi:DNA polymerase III epsilon subunit-like protein